VSGPAAAHLDRAASSGTGRPLLEVRHLSTHIASDGGVVRAVDDVSLTIGAGETLGLVGESGCGKTMTARSIVRLLPTGGRIVGGEVLFEGADLASMAPTALRRLRGHRIGVVFQDPSTSLNPVHTVGDQITEPMRLHLGLSGRAATDRATELLDRVGIPRPRERLRDYPHQLSGGMRQRVMIAIAVSCEPRLLIADEPTTALDVTIQAQILELIRELSSASGTAVLLITHDLGIAAGMCDRIDVMYAGRMVETAGLDDLFERPRMPYTWGLLDALPRLGLRRGARLTTIEGGPPDLAGQLVGCRFAPRCHWAREVCRSDEPELTARGTGHAARCHATQPDGWVP
jgi:oligopeptide transport system ATP-binding protein